jgi:hypothetical protein
MAGRKKPPEPACEDAGKALYKSSCGGGLTDYERQLFKVR